MERTRVLLVEDHPVVLHGMTALISAESDLSVAGQATTWDTALSLARDLQPDVVVLPVRLGGTHSGTELCRAIKAVCSARVVVYTSFTRAVDVRTAILAGADALVSKTATPESLLAVLREEHDDSDQVLLLGSSSEPEGVVHIDADDSMTEQLTDREVEVLSLIVAGLTNPEIAAKLTIEVTTVRTHVRSLLRKLRVTNRRDLLRPSE